MGAAGSMIGGRLQRPGSASSESGRLRHAGPADAVDAELGENSRWEMSWLLTQSGPRGRGGACAQELLDAIKDDARQHSLCSCSGTCCSPSSLTMVTAWYRRRSRVGLRHIIGDDEVDSLARPLLARIADHVARLRGKADGTAVPTRDPNIASSRGGQDVLRAVEGKVIGASLFAIFSATGCAGA